MEIKGWCRQIYPSIQLSIPPIQQTSIEHSLYTICWCVCVYVVCVSVCAQSCLTLCDPTDCSLTGLSDHGIFQARILEWAVISFSRDLPDPRIKP